MTIALNIKKLNAWPGTIEANTIYFVRVGSALEMGVSNNDGTLIYKASNVLSDDLPQIAGTASAGVSVAGARSDHVHPAQTTITGNAGTATTLQTTRTINGTGFNGSASITTANWGTARTITIGNTGKSVNGSAAVTWTLAEIGATNTPLASTNPVVAGTAAPGVDTSAARADHVHPAQTTITGNAGTATTLQTARTINGTSFNGSANITTTSWGTARTITIGATGKSVDGSAAVTWTLAEIGATNTPLADTDPIVAGTAAPGVGTSAARADHVHPAQTWNTLPNVPTVLTNISDVSGHLGYLGSPVRAYLDEEAW